MAAVAAQGAIGQAPEMTKQKTAAPRRSVRADVPTSLSQVGKDKPPGGLSAVAPMALSQRDGNVNAGLPAGGGRGSGKRGSAAICPPEADQSDEIPTKPPEKCCRGIDDFLPMPSKFEPKALDLNVIAQQKYGGRKYAQLDVAEQAELIRREITPKVYLVDPTGRFMRNWDIVMVFALFFVALITPYEVSFIPATSGAAPAPPVEFDWLYYLNHIMNGVFLFDMVLQFFLKVKVRTASGTKFLRTRKEIACNYMRGWFLIDLVSIIPFDAVLAGLGPAAKKLKVVRILRLLRLLKLMRVLRASRMIARWENHLSISYASRALMWFFTLLFFTSHIMACIWGLVGRMFTELYCPDSFSHDPNITDTGDGYFTILFKEDEFGDRPYPVDSGGNDLSALWKAIPTPEGVEPQSFGYFIESTDSVSWLVQLFNGGKTSPDNPCNPIQVYIWSLHWSVMTITSIGYGDMSPTRTPEYVLCIVCMLLGGILWAYIIGNLCATIATTDPAGRKFRETYDNVNYMMADVNLRQDLRCRIREYFRESQHILRVRDYAELQNLMSGPLKGAIAHETYFQAVKSVCFFQTCYDHARAKGHRPDFLVEVCLVLEPHLFAPREFFPQFGRMWLVTHGAACRDGVVFVPGSVFGEDMILDSFYLQNKSTALALNFCEVLCLTKENLMSVVQDFPDEAKILRKAAVRMAVYRGILQWIKRVKLHQAQQVAAGAAAIPGAGHEFAASASDAVLREFRQAKRLFAEHSLYDVTTEEVTLGDDDDMGGGGGGGDVSALKAPLDAMEKVQEQLQDQTSEVLRRLAAQEDALERILRTVKSADSAHPSGGDDLEDPDDEQWGKGDTT